MENLQDELSQFLKEANLDEKKAKMAAIEKKMATPEFWQDRQQSAKLSKELAFLQKETEDLKKLQDLVSRGKKEEFRKLREKLRINFYLSGKYDQEEAIFAIHAGQGGIEAMDWTAMLFRMYTRFFEKKNWQWQLLEKTPGEEAGFKSVALTVTGAFAYGLLKAERGVHRLVRQSPFNADRLRQTSFALVEVWPFLRKTSAIEVNENDLDWSFFRAAGHGGQNVNKVSTAVRVCHRPSGLTVSCQQERSQAQNREKALEILKAKLLAIKESAQQEKLSVLKGKYQVPGWGNQIRSYVLHPYHLVKDLRTGWETQDTEAVLDGKIEPFIKAYLKKFGKLGKVEKEGTK